MKSGEVRRKTYTLNYCIYCLRDQRNARERRYRKEGKAPKRVRTAEQNRIENARPANVEARKRYGKTRKGRAADRRSKKKGRWKKRARLTAALPTPVLKPFVDRAIAQTGSKTRLGEESGVSTRRIWSIVNEAQKGVSVEVVDKLATVCDFTLEEITERAGEWALLTGDTWPIGYKRSMGHNQTNDPLPKRRARPKD